MKSVVDRLTRLIIARNTLQTTFSNIKRKLILSENTDVYVKTAKINLPKGKIVVISNFIIIKGEHTLITASQGVSGVWGWWQGKTSTLFLREKPYLPNDTLRQVIAYQTMLNIILKQLWN
ncbi:hypothetical protein [Candidatus Portiera aleyrodidarum]|uniref:hypothetical protein n=1 Tax=Candidatus Portiera aleyrodidarum TaxID=91844 RepID=UPI00217F5A61|nr:hypothetical protein [Candidatus Portiera aleyrodidarum]